MSEFDTSAENLFESIGNENSKKSLLDYFIRYLSVAFLLYMFYATLFGPYKTNMVHRAIFFVVMLFIYYTKGKPLKFKDGRFPKLAKSIDWILILASIITLLYVIVDYRAILNLIGANAMTDYQMIIAAVLCIVVLETARRASITFWCVAVVGLLYALFGDNLGGILKHAGLSIQRILYICFYTEEGIFGTGLSVASTYLFMFVLFGSILQGTGASVYLMDLCNGLVGKYDGGAAKTAVIGSAAMGTVSGSSISNVVTTGSITIPLMKKLGFKPEVAGAVEVTASEGGQLMPPIMGAAAFIMAELTGIGYSTIAIAAVIPAILYFFNAFMIVHFEAKKSGIKGLPAEEIPNVKQVLKDGWHLLVPILLLFYLLMFKNYTTMFSGMVCILALLFAAQCRKHTRKSIKEILDILEAGVRSCADVVAILGGLGLIQLAVVVTGLGARLSTIFVTIAAGSDLLLILLSCVVVIILGCGMTTPIAYTLAAVFVAPALVSQGYGVLPVHMFLFFFAIKSGSTPPVAVVAAVAAGIAKADFWKTAFKSTQFATATFLVAFGYLLNPAMLLIGSPLEIIGAIFTGLLGVLGMASAVQGWLFNRMNVFERVLMLVGATCAIMPESFTDIVGVLIMVYPVLMSYMRYKKGKAVAVF